MKNKLLKEKYISSCICLFLFIVTLSVYWQITKHEFINYDDGLYVTENPHVQAGLNRESIIWAFTTGHAANWHPLTWLSHMLDIDIYGLNPIGHHLTNLQFHILNSILLFLVLKMMTGALWQSSFVAALFALHPLHVESVAWVSERKDVLSAFFWILSMWAYVRYVRQPDKKQYLLLILFFALGLMSKSMLVTLPFVLLLLDFWPLSRLQPTAQGNRHYNYKIIISLVLEKVPLFVLTAVSSFVTFSVQQHGGAIRSLEAIPMDLRIANALFSYLSYLGKTIWPQNLALIYPYPYISMFWQIILSLPLLICISMLVIRLARAFPYLATGWLWYLGSLVPVIGLVQVGNQSMADRYTYIPLIGIFIIVAWGVADFSKRWRIQKNVLVLLCCSVLALLMVRTWHQVWHWQNSFTLLSHSLNVTHNNSMAHYVFGQALDQQGRLEEAVLQYNKAIKIRPKFAMAHNNLGAALSREGKLKEAIYHFNEAVNIHPDYAKAHNNLATVLLTQGKFEEALSHYREALMINPEDEYTRKNLANFLSNHGRIDEALSHYNKALLFNPEDWDAHYKLGHILVKQEKINEALSHFAEVIRINPDYAPAYNEIGIILAKKGKLQKSNDFFLKAIQLEPDYKEARDNLLILNKMMQYDEK
ncbi:MAG: tetratricopeptide repeat protein [Proteobacteria bacterium]|nr:tetratricopeptide repeat protein [Pseudomonadota bacterium]MBU4287518.1 tetratricopeptide repeat protein [Pseudomonadota bacterium]MBU4415247.1 tetratricopeptide repeat protein [Pseudomonadota bacterium]MCG2757070.1 tetratricopeptide repeat protein [Desulfobacteraceae bacterium]